MVEVHRRQWIIARSNSPAPAGFRTLKLSDQVSLHHHPDLPVKSEGRKTVIGRVLGDETQPDHHTPGRFVVIDWPWLSLDASGLLGVYYALHPRAEICSSSIALLSEASGIPIEGRDLQWGRGIGWDPPPSSRLDGFRHLFCDQAFNLETLAVETRPRHVRDDIGEEEAGRGLAEYLAKIGTYLAGQPEPIFLALSAGRDSRLLLAALLAAGVRFESFTNLQAPRSAVDAKIAERLAKRYGFRHHTLNAIRNDAAGLEALSKHTGGAESETGVLVAGDFSRIFPRDAIRVYGHHFELGRRFYEARLRGVDFATAEGAAEGIGEKLREPDAGAKAALADWHRHRGVNPVSNLDWIDGFYLDQRLGGWLAATYQGLDALPGEVISPGNSWRCFDLLMAATPERRSQGVIQTAAMDRLLPGISKAAPFNPPPLKAAIKRKVRSVLRGMRLEGLISR